MMSKTPFQNFSALSEPTLKDAPLSPEIPPFQNFLSFRSKPLSSAGTVTFGFKNYIDAIEKSVNFSEAYSNNHSPEADIKAGKVASVIFKTFTDNQQQTVTYHFWKATRSHPIGYRIVVSLKNKQIDEIEYQEKTTIPIKFFQITDENYVDIIPYDTARL